jgi:hypothetical protein
MSTKKIRVMISSQCNSAIQFQGTSGSTLSKVRLALKKAIEEEKLFDDSQLFEVWINEDAPGSEGDSDWWEHALYQVRKAHVVLVIYNGNAGSTIADGDVGICHAELQAAFTETPAKIRAIRLTGIDKTLIRQPRHQRFQEYFERLRLFSSSADTGNDVIVNARALLRDAVGSLVHLGVREGRKGKFSTGEALDWSRLDFDQRSSVIRSSLENSLKEFRRGAVCDSGIVARVLDQAVLFVCHGLPGSMGESSVRAKIGQPFIRDHLLFNDLKKAVVGPVHVIGCHKTVTETQAISQLGLIDAFVTSPPFGVWVVDRTQQVQIAYIANCRDETNTRHGLQRFFDWLEQSGEQESLLRRARSRKNILKAVNKELIQG